MAYQGYLLKVNGTVFPMSYICEQSYAVHPDQRQDLDSQRDATGTLHRTVVAHMPQKVEFTTLPLTNAEVAHIASITGLGPSNKRRDVAVVLYNPETDGYVSAACYIPNLDYELDWVEGETIHYKPIRYAFIEY